MLKKYCVYHFTGTASPLLYSYAVASTCPTVVCMPCCLVKQYLTFIAVLSLVSRIAQTGTIAAIGIEWAFR